MVAERAAVPQERHNPLDFHEPERPMTRTRTRSRNRQYAIDLNRVIHERVRLGIVSALAVNEALSFNDLKKLLKTSDGNLSVHARRLEEAGYVSCNKSFRGRVPRTEYRLTPDGRLALERYLNHMEALIQRVRET
jgi:DNA-binding HxlR family transcriptional regulator